MSKKILAISLFGACIVRSTKPRIFEITGAKHRALFVLLVTAPFGRRSRTFLQDILWGISCYDTGRQSLRRALSDIKSLMGEQYGELITTNNTDVILDLEKIDFVTKPSDGEFLEGLNVREKCFLEWVHDIKINPEKISLAKDGNDHGAPVKVIPSITVLPFKIVWGDNNLNVLGDWFAEEVCRSISRSNLLHVISHLSSRKFAKQSIDISKVRSALDVDYCLSGSLRIDGDQIIVDADFINAESGYILWTRRFTGPLTRFLNGAAEGIDEIVRAIGGMLASDALRYVQDREVTQVDDQRLLIAGVELMHRATLAEFAKSRELITEALDRVPNSAEIHAWLGKWYTFCVFNGWSSDNKRDTQTAIDCTARALDLNPESAFCMTVDGFAQNNLLRKTDLAEKRYNQALKHNPNEALSWLLMGTMHAFRDDGEKALSANEKARKLSPIDPFGYFYDTLTATTHLAARDYAKTLEYAERSLLVNDRHLSTLRAKITALHFLGRSEEVKVAGLELVKRNPDFTISKYIKQHPAAQNQIGRDAVTALKAAGVPAGD